MSAPGLFTPTYPGSDQLWIDFLAERENYLNWMFGHASCESVEAGGVLAVPKLIVTREMWRDAKLIIRLRGNHERTDDTI